MSRRRFRTRLIVLLSTLGAGAISMAPSAHAQGVTMRLNFPSNARVCAEFSGAVAESDAAMAACDRAIALEQLNRDNLAATRMNRGNLHLRRGEASAALADFNAVIEADDRNAEARLNRGVALMMLGQHGPAVAAITEALSLGVREPHKAYYNRAGAREALDDFRGAYEDYSTALAIEPDWGPANVEMQRLAQRRQEWLAAVLTTDAH